MENCPNCHFEVAGDATRCPRCGLPRDLPVYADDGTFLGTVFARPGQNSPTQGTATPSQHQAPSQHQTYEPTPGTLFRAPGGEADQELNRRRSRLAGIVAGVLATAAVLGVAVALVWNAAVANRSEETAPPPAPPPSAPSTSQAPPSPAGSATPSTPATSASTAATIDPAVLATISTGMVRVMATGCRAGDGTGTGFLINDHQVISTWSAIAEPASVVVQTADGTPVTGTLSRISEDNSLVLIDLDRSISGHQFELGEPYGDDITQAQVVMLGMRDDQPATPTIPVRTDGPVLEIGGESVDEVRWLDIASDQVAQGAPVVDAEGAVAGVVVTLPGYADTYVVLPDAVQKLINGEGKKPAPTDCPQLLGPIGEVQASGDENATLMTYFEGINAGDYAKAYETFTDKQKKAVKSVDEAADGWASTYDFNVRFHSDDGSTVHVSFDSMFKAGTGPEPDMTCARWDLDYQLVDGKIDSAKAHNGGKGYARC
ncbi:trypsin-like peptidase domain-containing protein [Propionibacteriaceae bacterium Y1700]|uniref:trypsin-like peptidase domain-containing protein n=1 Tax=Microlunatus sp. Y1700 TaxID=3418487 RepID=UPI003DA77B88